MINLLRRVGRRLLCWFIRPEIATISDALQKLNDEVQRLNDIVTIERYKRKAGIYTAQSNNKLKSCVCRIDDIVSYDRWLKEMSFTLAPADLQKFDFPLTRKVWEFVFVAQALYEREMLQDGKRGLAFAVGKEPLPALFAKYGCEIVATDIDSSTETSQVWSDSNQHGDSADDLYNEKLCDKATFDKNIRFMPLDMRNIPDNLSGFDFCWSCCAMEHLGSIENGKQFIYNMLKCLKPGGIAIHTTEYCLSGDIGVESADNAIFSRSDIEDICNNLTLQGHHVEGPDFRLGDYEEEDYVAYPPYENKPHFKLRIGGQISTSFALIIQKA